jgi:hypothetical protein
MKLDPEVKAFSEVLHELAGFLREEGQVHWADKVDRCVRSVDQSDAYGAYSLLQLYGGMGSLDDLVLLRDGDVLELENERLDGLRTSAWRLADRLTRDAADQR